MKPVVATLLALLAMLGPVRADALRVVISDDGQFNYMETLVRTALEAAGQSVVIEAGPLMPQPRLEAALGSGRLSVHTFLRTAARDAALLPVPVGVTQGLMGRRILLIRPGDQAKFSTVRSLADLQALNLVAGFGASWFDLAIWRANGLRTYGQDGDWRVLFRMVASGERGVDYLALGAAQVRYETAQRPEIAIEQTLVLDYGADLIFYVSPHHAALAPPLARGMAVIEADGRLERLVDRYFGQAVGELGLGTRRVIRLQRPD